MWAPLALLLYNCIILTKSQTVSVTTVTTTTVKTTTKPPTSNSDPLIGYIPNSNYYGIPFSTVGSAQITATLCGQICGIYFSNKYAIVMPSKCVCTDTNVSPTLWSTSQCQSPSVCTSATTEICGCNNNGTQLQAVYYIVNTTYTVSIFKVSGVSSLPLILYINLIGPNGRETGEFQFSFTALSATLIVSFEARSLNGDMEMIRVGTQTTTQMSFSTLSVQIRDETTNKNISLNSCVGQLDSVNPTIDCYVNGSVSKTKNGDLYYSNVVNTDNTILIYCPKGTQDSQCILPTTSSQPPFLKLLGVQYYHIMAMKTLDNSSKVSDCEQLKIPSNVTALSRNTTGVGSILNLTCTSGYFITNSSSSNKLAMTCLVNGTWSPQTIPSCVKGCITDPPNWSVNVVSDYNPATAYLGGLGVIQYCCNTGMFSGFSKNLINVTCYSNGSWSLTKNFPECLTNGSNYASSSNSSISFDSCIGMGM